jgi:hypothetical protein
MPSNVVKSSRDERLWAEAKKQEKGSGASNKWAYIMATFQRMKNRLGGKKFKDYTKARQNMRNK